MMSRHSRFASQTGVPVRMPDFLAWTEAAMATESLVRKAILSGTDPQEAYLKYGKF